MSKHVKQKVLEGFVKRHPDGFGFFIPDNKEEEDVYVPKHSMEGIMSHDRVMVSVTREPGGDRFRGEIVKVLSRGLKSLVGTISDLNDKYMVVLDQAGAWGADLKIPVDFCMQAKSGSLVHVEITQYPARDMIFLGKVTEVIGTIEDPLNDIKRVLRGLNIPTEFSPATYKEVGPLAENPDESEFKNRKDIRSMNLVTIDGATAKDFDDAVFTEMDGSGFHLVVAIADVSHYVRPGTALDKDAVERGTSVYFPNFVVPMLPEELSNGLCSLKPNVPRLCLVADMHFNFNGDMTGSTFYEAVMQSKARVLYGEAQELVDGVEIEKLAHVKDNILRCADLAKVLMAKRFREGSLDLDIPETQLIIDASGNPVDVQKSERLFAHRLIEELMLAANVAVAKFLESKEIPSVYRVHEEPVGDNINLLERYLHNMGVHFRSGGGKLQKHLTKALQSFTGKPEGHIVNILTLRSMAQAKYSTQNIGHFGLGFASYTHFTSPIRRYPDLIVHRLIKSQIIPQRGYRVYDEEDLMTATSMLSSCEQRAVKSERQFMSIKKARFMSQHVGQEFTGMVSSVARFGVFVLLREYDIDGLVKLENLGDDKWVFDEDNLLLMGNRSKKIFKIGDELRIKVVNADANLGQIDFDLISEEKAFGHSSLKDIGEAKSLRQKVKNSRRDDSGKSRRDDGNRNRKGARSGKNPRSARESREPREARDPREARQSREPRESREPRQPREARTTRDSRLPRDSRSSRDARPAKEMRASKFVTPAKETKLGFTSKSSRFIPERTVDDDEDAARRKLIEEKLRKLGLDKPKSHEGNSTKKVERENFKDRKNNRKNAKKRR